MFALTVGMVLGFVAATFASGPSEAELTKQAKITKTEAEKIALAKVSHGTVKSADIEKEKGHLVWSFDIAKPNTNDITDQRWNGTEAQTSGLSIGLSTAVISCYPYTFFSSARRITSTGASWPLHNSRALAP